MALDFDQKYAFDCIYNIPTMLSVLNIMARLLYATLGIFIEVLGNENGAITNLRDTRMRRPHLTLD